MDVTFPDIRFVWDFLQKLLLLPSKIILLPPLSPFLLSNWLWKMYESHFSSTVTQSTWTNEIPFGTLVWYSRVSPLMFKDLKSDEIMLPHPHPVLLLCHGHRTSQWHTIDAFSVCIQTHLFVCIGTFSFKIEISMVIRNGNKLISVYKYIKIH